MSQITPSSKIPRRENLGLMRSISCGIMACSLRSVSSSLSALPLSSFLTSESLQTWEDPHHVSEDCDGHIGDNDPVDVVEVGDKTAFSGEIYAVKPVCGKCLILHF
jgi:hypothetical protein